MPIWQNLPAPAATGSHIEPQIAIPTKPSDCQFYNPETRKCESVSAEPVAAGPYRAAKAGWWAARWIGRAIGIGGSRVPLGFKNAQQFKAAVGTIRRATADDALIGVRGSAATGGHWKTGAPFGPKSDIDFFIISDTLLKQGAAAGARVKGGALTVGATRAYLPALHEVERALSEQLGRQVTIRVFGRSGYDAVRRKSDIVVR